METNAIQSETVPASTSLLASQVLNAKARRVLLVTLLLEWYIDFVWEVIT